MELLKISINLVISVTAFAVFCLALGKPWEKKLLKASVISGTLFKFVYSSIIFALWPHLSTKSDMTRYSFPRIVRFIGGELPNRDFSDPYSILYYPFLAIPVRIWRSTGSLVLTLLLMETLMIYLYLRRCRDKECDGGWRTVFLYCFSPFSFYWVALSGHNGIMITFWVMVSLILAEKGKAWYSGLAGAAAFLFTKILGILSWPAIAFYEKRNWIFRSIPLALSLILTMSLLLFGFDVISPYRVQATSLTSGNLWFLVANLFPAITSAHAWRLLPVLSFMIVLMPVFVVFLRRQKTADHDRFTTASSLYAITCLLFLIFSKKVYNYYILIGLIFIIHSLTRDSLNLKKRVMTYSFICAVSYLEQYLWYTPGFATDVFGSPGGQMLFLLNILTVGIYIYWTVLLCRKSIFNSGDTMTRLVP